MTLRWLPPSLIGLALLLPGRRASAEDLPFPLEVARTPDASLCPDASELTASLEEAVGRDVLETAEASNHTRFAVIFARLEGGFVATIRQDGERRMARTLSERHGSCAELGGAVVVALALMIDQPGLQPDPTPLPLPLAEPDAKRTVSAEAFSGRRHWYGWQTLALDGFAAALTVGSLGMSDSTNAGVQSMSTVSLGLGIATFALGPPIVHAAHRRWGIFGADIGLRIGTAVTFALLGAALDSSPAPTGPQYCGASSSRSSGRCSPSVSTYETSPGLNGAVIGGILGAAVASTLDATLLSRERIRLAPDDAPRMGLTWLPSISPAAHGATAGVSGTF